MNFRRSGAGRRFSMMRSWRSWPGTRIELVTPVMGMPNCCDAGNLFLVRQKPGLPRSAAAQTGLSVRHGVGLALCRLAQAGYEVKIYTLSFIQTVQLERPARNPRTVHWR